jgi:hypothetical protein
MGYLLASFLLAELSGLTKYRSATAEQLRHESKEAINRRMIPFTEKLT